MSLHINLLKEEERSDPSEKILHTASVTVLFGIGLGLALYVAYAFLMLQASQTQLAKAQRRSDDMRHNHKVALELISDISTANSVLAEMTAFSNAQIKVSQCLYAIAESVPQEVQITKLRLGNTLASAGKSGNEPARSYSGDIIGRSNMNGIDNRVRTLIATLNDTDDLLGKVTPGGISVDPSKSIDRIFEIRFALEPRLYIPAKTEAKKK